MLGNVSKYVNVFESSRTLIIQLGQPSGYDSNVSEAMLMEKFMDLLLSAPQSIQYHHSRDLKTDSSTSETKSLPNSVKEYLNQRIQLLRGHEGILLICKWQSCYTLRVLIYLQLV